MEDNKKVNADIVQDDFEIYDSEFEFVIKEFCEKHGLDSANDVTQSQWNAILINANRAIFKNKVDLKERNYDRTCGILSNHNKYNYKLLLDILDNLYIKYCLEYSKEVSIMGFSFLTGCNDTTIQGWANNEPSSLSFEIYKKLRHYQEESLSNKLVSGKQNPVGTIAVLNHRFGWAENNNAPKVKQDIVVIADTKAKIKEFLLEEQEKKD